MKRVITGFILMLLTTTAFTQSASLTWVASPVLHKANPQFANESAVILEDIRQHQFVDLDNKDMAINITCRRLIKINDDKGAELYNKIYIPVNLNTEQVLSIKARTIQPTGQVVDLPADKIFDVVEDGTHYKKFALEGIEKGCEIEYMYSIKRKAIYFGVETFQSSYAPCQKAEFTLMAPQRLVFSVKGYNGFKVSSDSVVGDQRIVTATEKDIVTLDDEKYSNRTPNLLNVQYKLSYNLSVDKNVRLFTWNEMAKNVYSNYTTFSPKEIKAIDNFIKQMNLPKTATEEEKIVGLEEYIKTTIGDDDQGGEDADNIEKIVKNNVASNDGLTKIFIAVLERLGINYQIVFPSKKDDFPIDENFENYKLIDDMLFYFPNSGNFIEPGNKGLRYPFIDPAWAATTGLFLKGTTIGTFKTAIASFDSIGIQPYEKNAIDLEVRMKFSPAMDSMQLHTKQILLGYGATSYRPAFTFLSDDKKEEFKKEVVTSIAKSDNIQNVQVQNTAMTDNYKNKPLIIEADITSGDILDQAGNNILVKLGEVIGPQVEMYQEKPRQLPIAMEYPHSEDRDIYFTIPAGYQIKNLSDINSNKTAASDSIGFKSSYTLSGNELHIKIHEYYKLTDLPVSMFQEFIKVINASADFNKVVLVLVKN
ncbi:MAG TPA: DUF3857 domain-containing protein [Ferruginibacter sp.]|jgi:hypothetical protein|nr:DUF3857 domain-containing protein [Ferruginibacter sp.]